MICHEKFSINLSSKQKKYIFFLRNTKFKKKIYLKYTFASRAYFYNFDKPQKLHTFLNKSKYIGRCLRISKFKKKIFWNIFLHQRPIHRIFQSKKKYFFKIKLNKWLVEKLKIIKKNYILKYIFASKAYFYNFYKQQKKLNFLNKSCSCLRNSKLKKIFVLKYMFASKAYS